MRLEPSYYKAALLFSSLLAATRKHERYFCCPTLSPSLSLRSAEEQQNFLQHHKCQNISTSKHPQISVFFFFFFSREIQMIPSFPLYRQMLLEEHIALRLMVQDTFFKACQNYQSFAKGKKKEKKTTTQQKNLKCILQPLFRN